MSDRDRAVLVYDYKNAMQGGYILQMRIWRVARPVLGSSHLYKYRLFFGRPGQLAVLYDNERLKGDHRHYGRREEPYDFRGIDRLVADFNADVRRFTRPASTSDPEGE